MAKPAKLITFFFFLFWMQKTGLKGQILHDPVSFARIEKGVENIYNCRFDDAKSDYRFIKSRYPEHAVPFLFKALVIYWEHYPLIPGSEEGRQFIYHLEQCLKQAEKVLAKNENDAENVLAGLGALGLMLLYYADNGQTRNVISLAAPTYQYVMKSFNFTKEYPDFYFITGLYNYYREAYPEAKPIYRPVVVFFPHGNKPLGLKQLKIAADSAIFLKAEAFSFLSGIYLSFEKKPLYASIYSRKLVVKFPDNIKFQTDHIKDLLLDKKYRAAETMLDTIIYPAHNRYLQMRIDCYRAVLYEKVYANDKKAEQYYRMAIKKSEDYKDYANEFRSYAYFGLSRINDRKGDPKTAKRYRKHAESMAAFADINFDD
ncbi:MAG: hypothetical protein JXB00_12045 [Bacteroidales bacterium]|nr:hypothetical protein [Bacteroidales bacterium]